MSLFPLFMFVPLAVLLRISSSSVRPSLFHFPLSDYNQFLQHCFTIPFILCIAYKHTHTLTLPCSFSLFPSDRLSVSLLDFVLSLVLRMRVAFLVMVTMVVVFHRRIWIFALKTHTHTHYLSAVNFCHYSARSENLFGLPLTPMLRLCVTVCIVLLLLLLLIQLMLLPLQIHMTFQAISCFFSRLCSPHMQHLTLTQRLVENEQKKVRTAAATEQQQRHQWQQQLRTHKSHYIEYYSLWRLFHYLGYLNGAK